MLVVDEQVVLDSHLSIVHNYLDMYCWRWKRIMPQAAGLDEKQIALREAHALNPHPQAVADALFTSGGDFFDARDLVQVKYEMLRRVYMDGYSVTTVAATFGVSRPTFYHAAHAWQRAGLAGLVPARPGPRRAHKLGEEVVRFLRQARAADPALRAAGLAREVEQRFGVVVVRQTANRLYVLYRGEIVESGPTDTVLDRPQHPYTQRLVASVPRANA